MSDIKLFQFGEAGVTELSGFMRWRLKNRFRR